MIRMRSIEDIDKANQIEAYCRTRKDCKDCPLYHVAAKYGENCYSEGANIEINYNILFDENGKTSCAKETKDNVNHPSHYETGKFECIDVMIETQGVEAVKDFCICNAFKYLYRHKNKNGNEDIKKSIWYLNKFLELEGENNEGS